MVDNALTPAADNTVAPLQNYNVAATDPALLRLLDYFGGGWGISQLKDYGQLAGSRLAQLGRLANQHPPQLTQYDAIGRRIDHVEFHPAYHELMATAKAHGLASLTWSGQQPCAQVLRSALFYLHNQAEAGSACPITMTHASVAAIKESALAPAWLPKILARDYDKQPLPWSQKAGLTIGMGMTEKQGGSDVRTNTTSAQATDNGACYRLSGHKWFFSAPMSDAFLVLAQKSQGLSCFLVPRFCDDGTRNRIFIQRLKDKLGDRSNASAEVELDQAQGFLISDHGKGIATILQMVAQTRLDCMLGSTGLIRRALVEAIYYAQRRYAFGKTLINQPLMQAVLTEISLETEAALALSLRTAYAMQSNELQEKQLARLATPAGKYWICKRAPVLINEAQECLGGNGYIEDNILPRLYRQAPVNSIWEGSGNIQCLDILRAIDKSPEVIEALFSELERAAGHNSDYDRFICKLKTQLKSPSPIMARLLSEQIAQALAACCLIRSQSPTAEYFCRAYLAGLSGSTLGSKGILHKALIEASFTLPG